MLKGYVTGLEKRKQIKFVIDDNDRIILNTNGNLLLQLTRQIIEKEIVNGRLNDGRHIKFYGCRYDGYRMSSQGYAYSKNKDKLSVFNRICFEGKAIDIFSGAGFSVMEFEKNCETMIRMCGVTPKPWENINSKYKVMINGISCNVGITYHIYYDTIWGSRNIGRCIPKFFIAFEKPMPIDFIPNCYLWVYDFFKFLNFRRNIQFDEIIISKFASDFEKYEDIGVVKIFSKSKEPYFNTDRNTITIDEVGENFGKLFVHIIDRREQRTTDDIFIPQNDQEFRTVSYTSFLECALSFEGEFDRTQKTKAEIEPVFNQVKELAISSVAIGECELLTNDEELLKKELLELTKKYFKNEVEVICDEKSKTKAKSVRKYAEKFLNALDKVDYSLEEQYNQVRKKYSTIVSDYEKELANRMEINLKEYPNLGIKFADLRNQIGHGIPGEIEDIHVFVFMLGRCLIYTMILSSVGLDEDAVKTIVKKLFY